MMISKISAKGKVSDLTITADISLEHLGEFDDLFWVVPSKAAIHCEYLK